jgi:IS30 family transposase
MEDKKYRRLTKADRAAIEQGIEPVGSRRKSARQLAGELGRSPSTVTAEVKRNRSVSKGADKGRRVEEVGMPEKACPRLAAWPYVCNGCRLRRYHCSYGFRCEYSATRAQAAADEVLSAARQGVNRTEEQFAEIMEKVRADTTRGLSPTQICMGRAHEFEVSPQTIYRWVALGYAGMSNMDLRRKVGYKPRRKAPAATPTSHGKQRSYAAFCSLPGEQQAAAVEMDTVIGRVHDRQCILTLYIRPCRFQLAILLPEKTSSAVAAALDSLEGAIGRRNFKCLFSLMLTDNGGEFSDPEALEASFPSGRRCQVYYCDARQSQQKGGCERNHVELRKLLPKGRGISFDDLVKGDMGVLMSHLNSEPRPSLLGQTPVDALVALGERAGEELLDAYGISFIPYEKLDMTPSAIDSDRMRRGLGPLV